MTIFHCNVPAKGRLGPQRTEPFLLYFCMFVTALFFFCCFFLYLQVRVESQSPEQAHQIVHTMPCRWSALRVGVCNWACSSVSIFLSALCDPVG